MQPKLTGPKSVNSSRENSSYRDPSGYVFKQDGEIYRQINPIYKSQFETLHKSGLYQKLVDTDLLVSHKIVRPGIIKPLQIPFISYPYEWCFGQLKSAALLTLKLQKIALEHEMVLKDASAFNVQFIGTKPIFIDTLSFDYYDSSKPWIAYKQFCHHFLAPLSLMAYKDVNAAELLKIYLDGIPISLASNLLPRSSWTNLGIAIHVHLHGKSQKRTTQSSALPKTTFTKQSMLQLIDNLESTVNKINIFNSSSVWSDYYTFTNYSDTGFKSKSKLVKSFLQSTKAKTVWDLGANTGEFSKIAADLGAYTVSLDFDWRAVNRNYLANQGSQRLLPLVCDLTNPSPSVGWGNKERTSLFERANADTVMALALIHHLAIANNLPLSEIAQTLSKLGKQLIIEFVPKSDSQVKKMLSRRADIFPNYNKKEFEKQFSKFFNILQSQTITDTQRTLYLMRKK